MYISCIKKKLFFISFVGLSFMTLLSNENACAMDIGRDADEEALLTKAVAIERGFLAQADEAIKADDIKMLKNSALGTIPFFKVVDQMPSYLKYAYGQHRFDVYSKLSTVHKKEAELYKAQQNFFGAGYQYDLSVLALEYASSLLSEKGADQKRVASYYGKITGDELDKLNTEYGLEDGYGVLGGFTHQSADTNVTYAIQNYKRAIQLEQLDQSIVQKHIKILKERKDLGWGRPNTLRRIELGQHLLD